MAIAITENVPSWKLIPAERQALTNLPGDKFFLYLVNGVQLPGALPDRNYSGIATSCANHCSEHAGRQGILGANSPVAVQRGGICVSLPR